MLDERIFLSLIILVFFAWFSLFPTLTQTYMTQMTRKGNCSSEKDCLFKLFEGLYVCLIKYKFILEIFVAWRKWASNILIMRSFEVYELRNCL